jgi:CTP synthase
MGFAMPRGEKGAVFRYLPGMQLAVIEAARNLCGLMTHSTEFDPQTPDPIIYLMEKWFNHRTGMVEERTAESQMGGTMRLGAYPCVLQEGTHAFAAYGAREISERHRHRYEFNNK